MNRRCAVHVEAFEVVVGMGFVVFPVAVAGDRVVVRGVVVVEIGPNVDVVL